MAHWGWYWKVKKKHIPKSVCSAFYDIDSFELFRNKEGIAWVKNLSNPILFLVPSYNLVARLQERNNINITSDIGSYTIVVEEKPCNFGGTYQFFHCPRCDKRMRKLYLVQGRYVCHKCASLGYYSQCLRSSELLRHELAESLLMENQMVDYDTAHTIVEKFFSWRNEL